MDLPEFLRDEFFDLLMSLNDKAKGGKLAWTIANDSLLLDRITKKQGLKASERRTNPQIDLLSDLYCISQIFIRWLQIICSLFDILLS